MPIGTNQEGVSHVDLRPLSEPLRSLTRGEMSVQEYLDLCKTTLTAYASVAERMLIAIGEPELRYPAGTRLSRIFANKMMKLYPAFASFTAWRR